MSRIESGDFSMEEAAILSDLKSRVYVSPECDKGTVAAEIAPKAKFLQWLYENRLSSDDTEVTEPFIPPPPLTPIPEGITGKDTYLPGEFANIRNEAFTLYSKALNFMQNDQWGQLEEDSGILTSHVDTEAYFMKGCLYIDGPQQGCLMIERSWPQTEDERVYAVERVFVNKDQLFAYLQTLESEDWVDPCWWTNLDDTHVDGTQTVLVDSGFDLLYDFCDLIQESVDAGHQ